MIVLALLLVALALAWPAPRLLPRAVGLREVPRAGLVLWQCTSLAAVVAGLAAGPMFRAGTNLLLDRPTLRALAVWLGVGVSLVTLGLLMASGHRTGMRLRRLRRRHRELVDLIALEPQTMGAQHLRVLEHPTPTAYCVPGLRQRVVLSQGTIDALDADELLAVLAHERAHLRARHDLVLEFFTVLHTAVPRWLRSEAGLAEVDLLVELLADRRAAQLAGAEPLARALVELAGAERPDAALAAGGSTTLVRLELLAVVRPPRARALVTYLAAAAVLALPVGLVALGLAV
jgi:Zn-dependent protease with chaperone function